MKSYVRSHIVGFVLFNLIVVSTVLLFTFWSVPQIPKKEEVRMPVYESESHITCSRSFLRDLSFEVENSEFYSDKGKLVSRIKLRWNGTGQPPQTLYLKARVFDYDRFEKISYLTSDFLIEPFKSGNEAVVTSESNVFYPLKKGERYNLYAIFDIHESYSRDSLSLDRKRLSEARPVLSIHPEKSNFIKGRSATLR